MRRNRQGVGKNQDKAHKEAKLVKHSKPAEVWWVENTGAGQDKVTLPALRGGGLGTDRQ